MKVLQSSIIYLISSILNKALPFFLLPILTKFLTPAEYGLLAIFQVFVSFFDALVMMSLQTNISKNFFQFTKEKMAQYISNICAVLFTNFGICLLIIGVITVFVGELFGVPKRWILALPLISMMNALNIFNLTILRNEDKPVQFGAFEISKTAVNFLITLILVIVYTKGWEGAATGIFVASLSFGLISFYYIYLKKFVTWNINQQFIKEVLHISLPLLPHAIGAFIITLSDRLFIDVLVDKSAVGLYSVGYMFGMIVLLCTDAFFKAWCPWFYKTMTTATDQGKAQIVKYTYIYVLCLLGLTFFISKASLIVLPFMSDTQYHSATIYVSWIAFGYAFNGLYRMLFPYVVHVSKTYFLGILTFSAAVFNLIANYVLIQMNGAIGAAQATLLTYAITFICIFIFVQRVCPMPWIKQSS